MNIAFIKVFIVGRIRVIVGIVLVFIITKNVLAGTVQTQDIDSIQAYNYYQKGSDLAKKQEFDSARFFLNLAANSYKEEGLWDRFFDAVYQVSYLYSHQYEYDHSKLYLDSIQSSFKDELSDDFKSVFNYYGSHAWVNLNLFNYIQTEEWLLNMVSILDTNPHTTVLNKIWTYYYLSVLYYRIGQNDEALKWLDKSQLISESNKNFEYLGYIYNLKGIINREIGEYERALDYYNQGFLLEKNTPKVQLTPMYNNYGRLYHSLGQDSLGIAYIDEGLQALADYSSDYYSVESRLRNNKALIYIGAGQIDLARNELDKALQRELGKYGIIGQNSTETILYYGLLEYNEGNYNKADEYYQQSLEIVAGVFGTNSIKLASIYRSIGDNYIKQKKFDEALENFQQSITLIVPEFDELDITKNPGPDHHVLDNLELIQTCKSKSDALMAYFNENNDSRLLTTAFETNELAVSLLEHVRQNLYYGESKQVLTGLMKPLYEQTISISQLALTLSGTDNTGIYYEAIFDAMEGSKSYLLSAALQKTSADGYSLVPDSLITLESRLFAKTGIFEKKLSDLKVKSPDDSIGISKIKQDLFRVRVDFEQFNTKLSQAYPGYVNERYCTSGTDLGTLQAELSSGEMLVSYFSGEERLYVLGADRSSVKLYDLGEVEDIESIIQKYLKISPETNVSTFQENALNVYRVILAPVIEGFTSKKNLIIIPDGLLGYLPFDALVTDKVEDPSFTNLKYEIHEHTITQHYLASLYLNNTEEEDGNHLQSFIGYAPDFDGAKSVLLATRSASDTLRLSMLTPLPFAIKEVSDASQLLKGVALIGPAASESQFKNNAGKFQYVHVASHSLINDEDPLYSRLVLAPEEDEGNSEDGLLYAYELYSMNINCELVTLSACNTGVGGYKNGEGIISLARGFIYSGASSVLMSLWEVADESTSQIMHAFYKELEKGEPRNDAIRSAKLDYLSKADAITANPYYWAGFTYLGEKEKQDSNFWIYLTPIFVILLVVAARRRKQKK